MRSFTRSILTLTLLAASVLPAPAGDRVVPQLAERRGDRHHRLERLFDCLADLDLSESQRGDLRTVFEAARTDFQADRERVRAAREKISQDVVSGADACLVGEDYLAVHAAQKALRERLTAVREQVLSKLSTEQAARLAECLEGPGSEE